MGTPRQKKLAPAVIKNLKKTKPEALSKVLESVGYGKGLQNSPKRVLESEGFIEELRKLGFDENNAKRVVAEVLETGEDANRLKAADMIFKVNATYAPERSEVKTVNVQANLFFARPEIMQATKLYEEQLKQAIINETEKPTETL